MEEKRHMDAAEERAAEERLAGETPERYHPDGMPHTRKYLGLLAALVVLILGVTALAGIMAGRQAQYAEARIVKLALRYYTLQPGFSGTAPLSGVAELCDREILSATGESVDKASLRGRLYAGGTTAEGAPILPNPVCLIDAEGNVTAFSYYNSTGRYISCQEGGGWSISREAPDFCAAYADGAAPAGTRPLRFS